MRRIGLAIVLMLSLIFASLGVEAQQTNKRWRIGYLRLNAFAPLDDAFRRGLRELGYVEGQNIQVEFRYAANSMARLAEMAAELVNLRVDVIVAGGTQAIEAARRATTTIPIVFPVTFDPVASGFVQSLARPGANLTGFNALNPVITAKRVEILKEILPGLGRLAVLRNPTNPGSAFALHETEEAAKRFDIRLQVLEAQAQGDLQPAVAEAAKAHADAIMVISDNFLIAQQRKVIELITKHRLPSMFDTGDFVHAGGLISYGTDLSDLYRRAATYVDKILKGAKPADLPVEQATKFDLVMNARTAKALRLTIPQSILVRADKISQ